MRIKHYLKHALYISLFYSGLLHLLIVLCKKIRRNNSVIILFYHRFHKGDNRDTLLPSHEIGEFKRQILYLKKFYTFVSMDELAQHIKSGSNVKAPMIALTIDDGYLSNYTLAYPILRHHQIPCTIYLISGLIGTRSGLWLDDIDYALMKTSVQTLSFQDLFRDEIFTISTLQERTHLIEQMYRAMLKMSNAKRNELIQEFFDILCVDYTAIGNRQRIMLNWDEIREMASNGVEFGVHTVTHPFLPAMPLEDGKNEIMQSKDMIEKEVGRPIKHFAVPNGTKEDFTPALKKYCSEIGFDTVVMTEAGTVTSQSDRYELSRTIPPPPLYYFACEIARYLFFPKENISLC